MFCSDDPAALQELSAQEGRGYLQGELWGEGNQPPLLLICARLLGHRELIQVGRAKGRQLCPGAALLHSTAGLGECSADGMKIEEKGQRDYRMYGM